MGSLSLVLRLYITHTAFAQIYYSFLKPGYIIAGMTNYQVATIAQDTTNITRGVAVVYHRLFVASPVRRARI